MIQCLGATTGLGESLSEFPELAISTEPEEWAGDSIPALMDPDVPRYPGSQRSEGFSHDLLSLLEQLLAEALAGQAEPEEQDAEEHPLFTLNGRRSS